MTAANGITYTGHFWTTVSVTIVDRETVPDHGCVLPSGRVDELVRSTYALGNIQLVSSDGAPAITGVRGEHREWLAYEIDIGHLVVDIRSVTIEHTPPSSDDLEFFALIGRLLAKRRAAQRTRCSISPSKVALVNTSFIQELLRLWPANSYAPPPIDQRLATRLVERLMESGADRLLGLEGRSYPPYYIEVGSFLALRLGRIHPSIFGRDHTLVLAFLHLLQTYIRTYNEKVPT